MAYFDMGVDVLTHFLRRVGELFPNDTTLANADRLIDAKLHCQTGYWDFCALKPWRWARVDPPVQFASPAKVTGSVTVPITAGATSITLGATIATSMAGRKFIMDSEGIPFRILAHTAGTAVLTFQAGYTGIDLTGSFTIFQDELFVADDILAFPVLTELHTGDTITVLPEKEYRERFPRNVNGSPRAQYATFITDQKIALAPWTNDARLFEMSYNVRPDPLTFDGNVSTDTPICPRNARELIGVFGLRRLMVDRRDQRIQVIQAEIQERLNILGGADLSLNPPRSIPKRGSRVSGR